MKICIPTETESGPTAAVCGHFGRAPFWALADTESGQLEFRPSAGCQGHDGHHVGQLAGIGVGAVVCRGLGRRAHAALRESGIEVLLSERETVSGVLEDARDGRLRPMPEDLACQGGHGEGHHGHGAGGHGCQHRGRQR
jgi:predicted Fe-Mo cluster-binding NifX family protein